MSTAALVLVCALDMMGRSAHQLPPIAILGTPPPGVSPNAAGFADRTGGVIYLIASAPAFTTAIEAHARERRCADRDALRMIASIIAHEEWHVEHGSDERDAYAAQLTELNRLGLGPGTRAHRSVTLAMQWVVARQAKQPRQQGVIAAAR